MKSAITASLLVALTLIAPAVWAAENTIRPMGMMDDKHMTQMQDNMKRMQQQMDKAHQAKNSKERQKLMQEHMQTMHTNMQMMRSMGGQPDGRHGAEAAPGHDGKTHGYDADDDGADDAA